MRYNWPVACNSQEKPRTSSTKENLAVLPLAVVVYEVSPAGLWWLETDSSILKSGSAVDLVGVTLGVAKLVSFDILAGLVDITSDIEGIAGSLRNGETEVKRHAAWHSTETNDDTPHLVNGKLANTTTFGNGFGRLERFLEASGDDEGDDGSCELTNTLHGKHASHHGSSPFGGSESAPVSQTIRL